MHPSSLRCRSLNLELLMEQGCSFLGCSAFSKASNIQVLYAHPVITQTIPLWNIPFGCSFNGKNCPKIDQLINCIIKAMHVQNVMCPGNLLENQSFHIVHAHAEIAMTKKKNLNLLSQHCHTFAKD